ncbi:MAG: hypothetical protein ACPG5P_09205, partial [Saprospiraceae bacterium]
TPTDATINDNFGNALAISNNDIGIIGANGKNNSGGASYSLDFSNNLFVTGKLIADLNDNCIEDGSDIPARNWLIKFSNGTDEYYTITDADGNWELYLNKNGNYTGEIIFPNPYWNICTPDISFNHTGGINEINIPTTLLEREISCSYLNIGITTNELVRCYSNQYLITYSNNGTTPETGVYIELNFDADLNVLGSSIPWTSQIGNNYRFDIDDLNVFESGSFTIEVEVDCSTELGRTHCSTASIYPQGFCFPSWNGDVISLEAECTGSDVEFRIGNIGLGNMLVPRSYIVTEDMVMRINEDYQLNSGLEELIIYPSNGATIRLETTQDIAYPFADSVLSLTYEGCGM